MLPYENIIFKEYDPFNKTQVQKQHVSYMLNRLLSMFKYEGLPDNIPQRDLELILLTQGSATFYHYDGKLRANFGALGGEMNEYYMPTRSIVTSPYLKLSKEFKIDDDCIVIPNDSLYIGILPLLYKYASELCENEITLRMNLFQSRFQSIISAPDDKSKKSAELFLEQVIKGKLTVVGENAFLDGIRVQSNGNAQANNTITNLIEYEQYLKASEYMELGLNAQFNMKREALNAAETSMGNDILPVLVDDMLKQRQIGIEKVNNMFGTDITVDLDSAWKDNARELEAEIEQIEEEAAADPEEEQKEEDDNATE